ncbi:hypothetical protein AB0H83_45865 [Dactylosporangium sp. NPDC050688]|uniref:hypothetical protein n=1 Tax=Dactylosporangium sp. NPDC050688 TaxID=3157217 RepID=UPI0033D2A1F5
MSLIPSTLPHGVTIPRSLAEPDARAMLHVLASHYGWALLVYGREDVERQLTANVGAGPHGRRRRQLTDEEWHRTRTTSAWLSLATTPLDADATTAAITRAIRQAGLDCTECGAALTGPPSATWGMCPPCLCGTDLHVLRTRACPVTGGEQDHDWTPTACRACGITVADQAANRRLTAVRAA